MNNFNRDGHSIYAPLDERSRSAKANKIIGVLSKQTDLTKSDVLDIGTGSGHIIHQISQICRSAKSINLKDERVVKKGYEFIQVDSEKLPFDNESFDIVITNHVIEHTPNQKLHMEEICRVLKKGGLVYLATPNKYAIIEPHFKLPFLSWLPRRIANFYAVLFTRYKWDVYSLSFQDIVGLAKPIFQIEDMSLKIIKNPREYNLDMYPALQPILKILPFYILKLLHPVLPSFIIILHKQ